jgi:hypothetical protein
MFTSRWMIVCMALFCLLSTPVVAATADQVEEAKRDQAFAEANQKKAEAEAAEQKAKLGTLGTANLPKGTGDATALHIEGTILAYQAIDRIADRIAQRISASLGKGGAVIIYNEKQLNAVLQANALLAQAKLLNSDMPKVQLPPLDSDNPTCTAPLVGGAVPTLTGIDIGLQLVSLFKVDKKLAGMDVAVDDYALAMAVVNSIKTLRPDVRAVYPPSYVPGAFAPAGQDVLGKSLVAAELDTLSKTQAALSKSLAGIAKKKEAIQKRVASKKETPTCAKALADDLVIATSVEATGQMLKTRADKFVAVLTAVDDKTGATLLQSLAVAEAMARDYSGADVLQLKSIAGGGATLTKTNLFTTSFRFSGGAIISFLLMDGSTGEALGSGTVHDYGGFISENELSGGLRAQ